MSSLGEVRCGDDVWVRWNDAVFYQDKPPPWPLYECLSFGRLVAIEVDRICIAGSVYFNGQNPRPDDVSSIPRSDVREIGRCCLGPACWTAERPLKETE